MVLEWGSHRLPDCLIGYWTLPSTHFHSLSLPFTPFHSLSLPFTPHSSSTGERQRESDRERATERESDRERATERAAPPSCTNLHESYTIYGELTPYTALVRAHMRENLLKAPAKHSVFVTPLCNPLNLPGLQDHTRSHLYHSSHTLAPLLSHSSYTLVPLSSHSSLTLVPL